MRGGGFGKLHAAFMYNQHLSKAPRGTSCLPGRLSVSGWLRGCSGLPRCGSPMLTSHSADGLPACFLPPHPPPPIFDWLPGWGGGGGFVHRCANSGVRICPPMLPRGASPRSAPAFFSAWVIFFFFFFLLYFAPSYNYYFSEYCFSLPCGYFSWNYDL